ncbi:MAG TPA: N-acetyl-1-D-myo-inositol-2-amino-2-deoxy-alpha-D-glucopyranoside deacetylase [Jiangellaceae bacterium]|nr:N-acetyl-1-D-myo-inositol-2-amino-2-deoxy-alpha-D-glucopyranoside deacetylase [Jiangellaceae bacterium]
MTTPDAGRRLLLVHAHPDDETISNGATMAKYVAEGAHVTLVTCTLGEEGEVLVPDLAHLASHREDALGPQRVIERKRAMDELGVADYRFLGGAGRFRDTGMAWGDNGQAVPPADVRSDTFWAADLREASDELVAVIRELRPQVLVTYDEMGGYGHPDHIQAHRVATYGAALAAAPSYRPDLGRAWEISKIYWTAIPRSVIQEGIVAMREIGSDFFGLDSADETPFAVSDELITAKIDAMDHVEQKLAAMRAYVTQIAFDGPFFALSDQLGPQVWGLEFYRLVKGEPGPANPDTGWESDLFAGLGI